MRDSGRIGIKACCVLHFGNATFIMLLQWSADVSGGRRISEQRTERKDQPLPADITIGSRTGRPLWGRRRTVTGAIAAAPVAVLAAALGSRVPPDRRPRPLLDAMLGIVFADLEAARAVGRAYLAGDPRAAAGAARLADALAAAAAAHGPEGARRRVAALRESALRRGDVVLVDGWVLARAEAELCVLALAG